MNINIDNEFKALIDPLSDDEWAQLQANILDEGCRDPLVVWAPTHGDCKHCENDDAPVSYDDGIYKCDECGYGALPGDVILLDGHNRYEICTKNDIDFEVVEKHFSDRSEAIIWMIDNQLGRRNLIPAQRLQLTDRMEAEFKKRAKANQVAYHGNQHDALSSTMTKVQPVHTRDEKAKRANVSTGTVAKYDVVNKSDDEETKSKMLSGEISINKAYQKVKKDKAKDTTKETEPEPVKEVEEEEPESSWAMDFAHMAIEQLKRITQDDPRRLDAFNLVNEYIQKRMK